MGLIPVKPTPKVPEGRIPFYVAGLLDIQKRALFWARASVAASLVVGVAALALAWRGAVPWWAAAPFFLLPLVPISAQTRIEEMGRKTLDQVRDVQNETLREAARTPPEKL